MEKIAVLDFLTSPLGEGLRNCVLIIAGVVVALELLGRYRKNIVVGWELVHGFLIGIVLVLERTLHRLHDDLAPEARRHPRLGAAALAVLSGTLYLYVLLIPTYSLAVNYVIFRAPIDSFPFSLVVFLAFTFVGSIAMAGYLKREARWARLKSREWWQTAQATAG